MLDKDAGLEALRPHALRIGEAWRAAQDAMMRYKIALPDDSVKLNGRVEAAMMSAFVTAELKKRFIGVPGVTITERWGRLILHIADLLSIRFKKLDRNLQSRYTPTQSALAFFETQGVLEEMPESSTNAVSGYTRNAFGDIGGLYITCPLYKQNMWVVELEADGDGGGGGLTLGIDVPGPTPPIIRPKTDAAEKKADESAS